MAPLSHSLREGRRIIVDQGKIGQGKPAELLFERIQSLMKARLRSRPFVIGINGIDGAGKTRFADELSRFLVHRSCTVQLVHVDDFHNSKAFRYGGDDEAENYYYRSIVF